ncbi:MAG TPA: energy transducer TonB [Polyangia bacterium]
MRKRTEMALWSAVVVTSLGLHAVAFGGLGHRDDGFGRKRPRPPTLVEMSVQSAKAVQPPAAPKADKPAPRLAMAHPARAKAAPPPPQAPSAPPPSAESPADFTGVTMTNDGAGPGWASATGNGETMHGAVGRAGARVTHRNVDGDGPDVVRHAGPPVVAAADLSRAPVAPDLAPALARAYPAAARSKGIAGRAVVHARILPDGHVCELALLSESEPGFGAACQTTLRGSIWSPPVDRQARAVSTFVNYTCRFEVQ